MEVTKVKPIIHSASCKKSMMFFIVIAVWLSLAMCSSCKKKEAPAPSPPEVDVVKVLKKTVPVFGEYVGQTDSSWSVEVRAQVQGYIEKRLFVEGSMVQKGDTLFVIDPRPFRAALDEARANLTRNEAILAKAKRDVARLTPLYKEGAISQQDLDNAISAEEQAAATVKYSKSSVEKAEVDLSYTNITAPLSGLIDRALKDVGSLVGPQGDSLLTKIYQIDPIYVYFSMTELEYLQGRKLYLQKRLGRLGEGVSAMPVTITLPDNTTYKYEGKLNFAEPTVDKQTGTFKLRAEFPNPQSLLLPGQYTKVNVLLTEKPDALLIPQRAVLEAQGGQYVYVVGKDNKVEQRVVVTGMRHGSLWVIDKGLEPDERVIAEGVQKVRAGIQVKATEKSIDDWIPKEKAVQETRKDRS